MKATMKQKWGVGRKVAHRYQDIGHCKGDLMWWIDDAGLIQWQEFDGLNHHHTVSKLDMDLRWRGRLDTAGNATLLPPLRIYSLDAEEVMPLLPIGTMITLKHLGAKRFFLDTTEGLRSVKRTSRRIH